MNFLAQLLGGNLLEGVKDIINSLHLDPNKQAEITELLENHKAELAEKQVELEEKAMELTQTMMASASANIQAEENSTDKFTSRARPMFMYLVEGILGFNFIVIPLVALFGRNAKPWDLPTQLYELFGACVLGYVGARSFEKFLLAPGESSASFLGLSVKQVSPSDKK